jgi:hypothetical protein
LSLRVDIPVDLPDNTDVQPTVVPPIDPIKDEDEDERLLCEAIDESDRQIARGETSSLEEVLERLYCREHAKV